MEDAKKLRWQHLPIWKSGFPSLIILLVTNLSFKLLPINLASSKNHLYVHLMRFLCITDLTAFEWVSFPARWKGCDVRSYDPRGPPVPHRHLQRPSPHHLRDNNNPQ